MRESVNHVEHVNHNMRLIACPHIFSVEKGRIDRTVPAGGTVAEHLRAIGWQPESMHARVFIDGVYVEQAQWEYAVPRAGQSLAVRAIPMGGGGQGKDVGRMVAMIAIVAASIAIMQPELGVGAFLATGFGTAATTAGAWAGAAAAASSIIGTLAITARIPPALPRRCDQREVPHG